VEQQELGTVSCRPYDSVSEADVAGKTDSPAKTK